MDYPQPPPVPRRFASRLLPTAVAADRLDANCPALAVWITFLEYWQEDGRVKDFPAAKAGDRRMGGLV